MNCRALPIVRLKAPLPLIILDGPIVMLRTITQLDIYLAPGNELAIYQSKGSRGCTLVLKHTVLLFYVYAGNQGPPPVMSSTCSALLVSNGMQRRHHQWLPP